MAGIMGYFGGRRDPKQSARDAIVTLRQQLQLIDKKEEYLQKKVEDDLKKAKANAVTNKAGPSFVRFCSQVTVSHPLVQWLLRLCGGRRLARQS
jgi:hypothetical protein